ncbi:hypothetical protein [Paenibacillus tepidiphilus]|uniref:hypothetical protein n=1 Tax=Paenibacillus tepidiphilus TaxID=2608683 RepID=UPI001239C527|nr:hypothetical protein [Paenibacillus tepidiphilus]
MESDLKFRLDYGHKHVRGSSAGHLQSNANVRAESAPRRTLFWNDPEGRRSVQPWRRKLWNLKNNTGRD